MVLGRIYCLRNKEQCSKNQSPRNHLKISEQSSPFSILCVLCISLHFLNISWAGFFLNNFERMKAVFLISANYIVFLLVEQRCEYLENITVIPLGGKQTAPFLYKIFSISIFMSFNVCGLQVAFA